MKVVQAAAFLTCADRCITRCSANAPGRKIAFFAPLGLSTGVARLLSRSQCSVASGFRLGYPPEEVLGDQLAKEPVGAAHPTDDPDDAALLRIRVIDGSVGDEVTEIVPCGDSRQCWSTQILMNHEIGVLKGPEEAMTLLVRKIGRGGRGFKLFSNYELRRFLPYQVVKCSSYLVAPLRVRWRQYVG